MTVSNYQSARWTPEETRAVLATLAEPLHVAVRTVHAINPARTRKAISDRRILLSGKHDFSSDRWVQSILTTRGEEAA